MGSRRSRNDAKPVQTTTPAAAVTTPQSRWRRLAPLLIVLVLVAVAYTDILAGRAGLFVGDLTSYHYPMKSIVREAIAGDEFPYWNRYFSGGQPLAANPAYELFYPPQLLILLPSFAFGFQLHILVHFLLAAAGMYFLLRSLEAGEAASAFGALSFAFGGAYLSLSSMLPLLFSLSWLPLALLFARRWIRLHDRLSLIGAAGAIAMQMILGEPTMALQTGVFIAAYAAYDAWRARRVMRFVQSMVPMFALAAGLAAVQLFPAVDFARDSVRSQGFEFRVAENWSMPLVRPVEMLFPSLLRNVKSDAGTPLLSTLYPYRSQPYIANVYAGWLVAVLAIAGVVAGVRGRGIAVAAFAAAVIVAAGSHTPLFQLLYDVGLTRRIRFPEKFVVSAAVILVIWSSLVLHHIFAGNRKVWSSVRWIAVLLALFAAVAALSQPTQYFAIAAARAAAAVLLILLLRPDRRLLLKYAVLVISIGDLWVATRDTVPRMPRSYFEPQFAVLKTMPPSNGTFRVFHDAGWATWFGEGISRAYNHGDSVHDYSWRWRNSVMPNLAAVAGYEVALEDDVDQTSLLTTTTFREAMKIARQYGPGADTIYMKMSNVRYRIAYRQATAELVETARLRPQMSVPVEVRDEGAWPRHWFASTLERVSDSAIGFHAQASARVAENVAFVGFTPFTPVAGQVTTVRESANRIVLRTRNAGRGFLVIGVTGHRWWRATIDGSPATLEAANIAYQGLVVPPGEHLIELRYSNPLVALGTAISAASLLVAAAVLIVSRRRRDAA